MALEITADWVCKKVHLKGKNLDDVRTLRLPGSVEEKITNLGNSLKKFSRLKYLDLDRNDIEQLDGLQNLKMLERLNLYYNNISSLQELFKLRFNQRLQELDLRLNPVAGGDANYRLFLIHMLPRLRKLDDRPVRDNERRAALMHYSTDVAAEMSPKYFYDEDDYESDDNNGEVNYQKRTKARLKLVESVSQVDPNRNLEALIGDVERTNGDLTKKRPVTGSALNNPSFENYSNTAIQQMDRQRVNNYQDYKTVAINNDNGNDYSPANEYIENLESKYPHLATLALTLSKDSEDLECNRNLTEGNLFRHNKITTKQTQGFFTPTPNDISDKNEYLPPYITRKQVSISKEEKNVIPSTKFDTTPASISTQFLDTGKMISALADQYWDGKESLENNNNFLKKLSHILQQLQLPKTTVNHTASSSTPAVDVDDLKSVLVRSQRDVKILRERLQQSILDSKALHEQIANLESEKMVPNCDLDKIREDNRRLTEEISQLRNRTCELESSAQLASMLQQSHKSLVETNERLLKELKEKETLMAGTSN